MAACSCFEIVDNGGVVPRDHIVHVETLTTGRIVVDMIVRHPDVFTFLFEAVLQSQLANPVRYTPPPTWFSTPVDIERVKRAARMVNWRQWRKWDVTDDATLADRVPTDAYMLARSVILNCPIQMHGVDKMLPGMSWQQFKVTWSDAVEQAWERSGDGAVPEYVYHGSRLNNWYSILRNGIQVMSGTPWMSAGAAYGPGIYCSNTLNLSWSYSGGGPSVVIGVYEIWNAARYHKAKSGKVGDTDLDIYVVPTSDLLMLRYLIYMPDTRSVKIDTLDRTLRSMWQSRGVNKAAATRQKNNRIEARLRREVAALTGAGIPVDSWDTTRIQCRDVTITIPHQYPFVGPIFHGWTVPEWTPKCNLLGAVQLFKAVKQ